MSIKERTAEIAQELLSLSMELDEQEIRALVTEIRNADRIFLAGAGRSGLMIRAFAMRLMHIGFTAYVVGEVVTPAAKQGDLLIMASGSGTTATMEAVARKGKAAGVRTALITASPDSPVGRLSDTVLCIPTLTCKMANNGDAHSPRQPGGNTFEQCLLLLEDAVIIELMDCEDNRINNGLIMSRHANLE